LNDVAIKQEAIAWTPQVGPQEEAIKCPAFELLMGGAVGGGKTDFLLGDFAADLELGSKWKGVYFRRHIPDMDDVIHRSMEIFGPVYGEKCYNGSKYQWKFPNGAILQFRGLERDVDVYKYQGQQYTWVGWDELTQWASPFPYTYLMSRIRSAKEGVTRKRVRAATNPGGPGHIWVKDRFVTPSQPGQAMQVRTKSGDHYWRVFIPSKLEDNQILMKNDPTYADRIYEISDPILADALRNGRWDILAGAAFPEFDPKIHVIDPIVPPKDVAILRALDWGYKEPYGCLWCYHKDGDLIIFGELYGDSGRPNIGTEESPSTVRSKIENFEALHEIWVPKGLIDGQVKEERGQTGSIFKELGGAALGWRAWPKGPHSRVNQKQMVHELLMVRNGQSRLKITRNCKHLIRTLTSLPTDDKNREDVDTHAEDHLYDALRALCTVKIPTREEIRNRAMRRRMERSGIDIDQPRGGGF